MGKSQSKPSVTINENINGGVNRSTMGDTDYHLQIDVIAIVFIGIIAFILYKLNKQLKAYVNKKVNNNINV